mgnify:FL=1
MIKIWLLILFVSTPNMPSVKYNAFIYPTENKCIIALVEYLNIYESKSENYKKNLTTTGYCLPFDSFPIKGLHNLDL